MSKKLCDVNDNFYLMVSSYRDNKRLFLGIETDKDFWDDITINLPDVDSYLENAVFINSSLSKDTMNQLKKAGIIEDYIYTQPYNMGSYDCCLVNFEKIKEYDPKGFKEFENYKNLGDDLDVR